MPTGMQPSPNEHLLIEGEGDWEDATGNEGSGYDTARGASAAPQGDGAGGVGSELAEEIERQGAKLAAGVRRLLEPDSAGDSAANSKGKQNA